MSVFERNEINAFMWNIIFSSLGVYRPPNNFLFSAQLAIIVNLSTTLKNIVKSITSKYKPLSSTFIFINILSYIFACLAFFYLGEDFYKDNGEGVIFFKLVCRKCMWNFNLLLCSSYGLCS